MSLEINQRSRPFGFNLQWNNQTIVFIYSTLHRHRFIFSFFFPSSFVCHLITTLLLSFITSPAILLIKCNLLQFCHHSIPFCFAVQSSKSLSLSLYFFHAFFICLWLLLFFISLSLSLETMLWMVINVSSSRSKVRRMNVHLYLLFFEILKFSIPSFWKLKKKGKKSILFVSSCIRLLAYS